MARALWCQGKVNIMYYEGANAMSFSIPNLFLMICFDFENDIKFFKLV